MDKNNVPSEEVDRNFPEFQEVEDDRLNSNPLKHSNKPLSLNSNTTEPKSKTRLNESKNIGDRFFLYIFSVSGALGFLGTIIPKTSIEQTTNLELGQPVEIVTSTQGDTFTQVVGYSLASLAAIMGLIKKLASR